MTAERNLESGDEMKRTDLDPIEFVGVLYALEESRPCQEVRTMLDVVQKYATRYEVQLLEDSAVIGAMRASQPSYGKDLIQRN